MPREDPALAAAITRIVTEDGARNELVRLGFRRPAGFSRERTARETAPVYAAVRTAIAPRVPAGARERAAVPEAN